MLTPDHYFRIYYLSEQAVTVEFGQQISEDILQQISNFDWLVHHQPFTGFSTTVPAYATLTVYYDPLLVIQSNLPGLDCFEKVSNYLYSLKNQKHTTSNRTGDIITIPVYYGGDFGPDIAEVAAHNQLTVDEVTQLHSAAIYKVYMIGFVPGFAYLGGMNERLATPRKASPRKAVPAGAVGIAGQQTGVYPLQTPGGWQIIGQTPVKLFDANKPKPSLLKVGDNVVFKPIDMDEFTYLSH